MKPADVRIAAVVAAGPAFAADRIASAKDCVRP